MPTRVTPPMPTVASTLRRLATALAVTFAASASAPAPAFAATPVKIYAAGSLSGVMMAMIAASGQPAEAFAEPVFGPAGLLSQRIVGGEATDLFFSADLAAPERVAAAGKGVMLVPFAKNRMCVAAKPSVGLTAANVLDKLLAPDLRLATLTPGNDPGGDYALAVFKKAEGLHPGADKVLTDKALHLVGGPATMVPVDGRSPSASIFLGDHADLFLYYCSSAGGLLKEVPDLTNLPLPETLEVHPVYGLAVISDDAAAERFALFVLSLKGQAMLKSAGFEAVVPVE